MTDEKDPYNAKVIEKRMIHEALGVFRVAYEDGESRAFEPGQFTNLALLPPPESIAAQSAAEELGARDHQPKRRRPGRVRMVRRAYSIASPPSDAPWLEFYIVAVDEGALTPRVFDLKVGDRLFMDTKIKGHFTMKDVPAGKDIVTVATGTGLAPFLSMYHHYKDQLGRFNRFVFVHGVRHERDLGYREQLEALAASDHRVLYLPAVTRPGASWTGYRGRVTTLFKNGAFTQAAGRALDPEQDHVFLCGNPAMIDELELQLIDESGFFTKTPREPDGNLHFERYW